MKKILSAAVMFVLLFCNGCSRKFTFQQDQSEIFSIEIVSLKYSLTEENMPEELLICDVDDILNFLSDFSKIDVTSVSPPKRFNYLNTPTVIKITYRNGEFEWIAPKGTMVCRANNVYNFYGSTNLDEDQFAMLIEKYVGEDPVELEYNFLLRETNISSIEVVKLGEAENSYSVSEEQTVICKINNTDDFLKKLAGIDCFLNIKSPTKAQDGSIVFKISYGNDYYELIGANGQSKFYGENFALDGYRYFNEQQFNNLMNSYIEQR